MSDISFGVDAESISAKVAAGDRRALSVAITAVEGRTSAGRDVLRALGDRPRRATVVGVTGPPGAGKSTLVGGLVDLLLARGRRVGVLLVDPSSPLSGGAVLADRVRMRHHAGNDALYVRSVGSRGQQGGLSRTTEPVIRLLDTWGADLVLVETVGAGQGEVAVHRVADCTVVVCPPGLGDEFQAMKAGLMEIADIFVVNKADLPGASRTAATILGTAGHAPDGRFRPVLSTVATTGDGVAELAVAIETRKRPPLPAQPRTIEEFAARAGAWLEEQIVCSDVTDIADLVRAMANGEVDLESAARQAASVVART